MNNKIKHIIGALRLAGPNNIRAISGQWPDLGDWPYDSFVARWQSQGGRLEKGRERETEGGREREREIYWDAS